LLNLIDPQSASSSSYFISNANYKNYWQQSQALQKMFGNFNVDSWHSNAYWANFDISSKFLRAPELSKVSVMKSQAWQVKNFNTVLAAWANQELPSDTFAPYASQGSSRLNQTSAQSVTPLYSYIEPDMTLNHELISNTEMIIQMLTLLNVGDGENSVLVNLKTMEKNLLSAQVIIEKELQNTDLTPEDYAFINDFTHAFSVTADGKKSFGVTPLQGGQMMENLAGVKLLVYSFMRGDQKFFAVGRYLTGRRVNIRKLRLVLRGKFFYE
jgi:hypothetical protein